MKRNFHFAAPIPIGLIKVVKKPAPRTKNLSFPDLVSDSRWFLAVLSIAAVKKGTLTAQLRYLAIFQHRERSRPCTLDVLSVSGPTSMQDSDLLYASALFPILYHYKAGVSADKDWEQLD